MAVLFSSQTASKGKRTGKSGSELLVGTCGYVAERKYEIKGY